MTGCHRILFERSLQLLRGHDDACDASHAPGELSRAALARLLVADYRNEKIGLLDVRLLAALISPWDNAGPFYQQTRERLLIEAGALVAAELDRMNPAAPSDDDRPTYLIMEVIGKFARATGNVGRIADLDQRLKALKLLADFAQHLVARIDAETDVVIVAAAGPANGKSQPKQEGK